MNSKTKELLEYNTVDKVFETEEIINKSRFISRIYPISSEEEANEIIKQVKKEHYKSTHVCSAWVLATEPIRLKASDDGEPSGTAGRPILEVIQKNNLRNVLVLVIRYFGGIKLGAGGLVRAYSGGCADVIKNADIGRIEETATVNVQTEYSFYQPLKLELEKLNIYPVSEEFTDIAEMKFKIPSGKVESFEKIIQDFTNDNYLLETLEIGPQFLSKTTEEILL